MTTLFEANQVSLILKMKLSQYAWYKSSSIISDNEGYIVLIGVNKLDNSVRKIIPQVLNDVSVKTELEN